MLFAADKHHQAAPVVENMETLARVTHKRMYVERGRQWVTVTEKDSLAQGS